MVALVAQFHRERRYRSRHRIFRDRIHPLGRKQNLRSAFTNVVGCIDGTQIRLQSPGTNELDFVASSFCMPSHDILYRGQFMTSTHLHVNYVVGITRHACACVRMRAHACACVRMRAHACACVRMRAHACA